MCRVVSEPWIEYATNAASLATRSHGWRQCSIFFFNIWVRDPRYLLPGSSISFFLAYICFFILLAKNWQNRRRFCYLVYTGPKKIIATIYWALKVCQTLTLNWQVCERCIHSQGKDGDVIRRAPEVMEADIWGFITSHPCNSICTILCNLEHVTS